jgi:hypothetical protein
MANLGVIPLLYLQSPTNAAKVVSSDPPPKKTVGQVVNNVCVKCNLKAFKVQNDLPKALIITEIFWQISPLSWAKCNSHGASKGNPNPSAC